MKGPSDRAAVFTTDPGLSQRLAAVLERGGVEVVLSITRPFTEVEDSELETLKELDPRLIVLDLTEDVGIGLKFAQFLAESRPTSRLIGMGASVSSELLLAAMQAGIAEYLPKPLDDDHLLEALARIQRKWGNSAEQGARKGKMITVFSPKGGSGTTTLATNLAISLHRIARKKTLLVDLDLELGETALLLGIEPKFSTVDLLENFHRADAGLLASYIDRHESGIELLSAPYEPADTSSVDRAKVRQVLEFLRSQFDYVIVDAAKGFGPATASALEVADEVFVLVTPDLPSVRNVARCRPLIDRIRGPGSDGTLRFILNRSRSRQAIPSSEIVQTLDRPIYWAIKNDYRAVIAASNAGRPVMTEKKSEFAKDVQGLAARVAGVKLDVARRPLLKGFFTPIGDNGAHPVTPEGAVSYG